MATESGSWPSATLPESHAMSLNRVDMPLCAAKFSFDFLEVVVEFTSLTATDTDSALHATEGLGLREI